MTLLFGIIRRCSNQKAFRLDTATADADNERECRPKTIPITDTRKGQPFKYLSSHGLKNKRKGGFPDGVMVDPEDEHLAYKFTWYLKRHRDGLQYAQSELWERGRRVRMALHRVITNAPKGSIVDHINHNTLDNRRCNLRVVDKRVNGQNRRGVTSLNRSGYRNVCCRKDGRFTAQVNLNGKSHYLGIFDTAKEAGETAAEFRRKHMPNSTI